ncbi:hypothetical protein PMG11_08952 [Penicillium brasilianum]|uniref:BTB domain-containing protein n=1 Tax=Penicillium brasilianum TaxID=104259 RepID=A0A0F7TYA6_PENBI|nr:hypothetical protein PMG11_08952 [Penicillium brasilianum]
MAAPEPAFPISDLQKAYEKLLLSGDYSDLQIVCQETTFKVHQCIICPRSSFVGAAIKHPFKESSTGVIELPADHPGTVERIIVYLYRGDYKQTGHLISMATAEDDSPAHVGLNRADVYITADKYDIQPLKTLAANKMTSWAKGNFKTPGFVDMARHLLQMKHDPCPFKFVGQCIRENVRSLTLNDAQIFKLIGDFGHLGEAIVIGIIESRISPRVEADHFREKLCLQDQIVTLNQEVADLKKRIPVLTEEIAGLMRENRAIQQELEDWHEYYRQDDL